MKRILFVDDDELLLAGLRMRLRALQGRWQMRFVASGEAAVKALEVEPSDVIVTDLRMPRMDGAELLQTVSTRWPEVIRIVLSGDADPQASVRVVPFAHQYISRPCEADRLENLITRCFALRR